MVEYEVAALLELLLIGLELWKG